MPKPWKEFTKEDAIKLTSASEKAGGDIDKLNVKTSDLKLESDMFSKTVGEKGVFAKFADSYPVSCKLLYPVDGLTMPERTRLTLELFGNQTESAGFYKRLYNIDWETQRELVFYVETSGTPQGAKISGSILFETGPLTGISPVIEQVSEGVQRVTFNLKEKADKLKLVDPQRLQVHIRFPDAGDDTSFMRMYDFSFYNPDVTSNLIEEHVNLTGINYRLTHPWVRGYAVLIDSGKYEQFEPNRIFQRRWCLDGREREVRICWYDGSKTRTGEKVIYIGKEISNMHSGDFYVHLHSNSYPPLTNAAPTPDQTARLYYDVVDGWIKCDTGAEVSGIEGHFTWLHYIKDAGPRYSVTLSGIAEGGTFVDVVKVVRDVTGLGLKDSKALVDNVPSIILTDQTFEKADLAREKITAAKGVAIVNEV